MLVQGPPTLRPPPTAAAAPGAQGLIQGIVGQAEHVDDEEITHFITFWRNGFTVGNDPPLHSYEESYGLLQQLHNGLAPRSLFPNVGPDDRFNLGVKHRLNEDFTPPVTLFSGTGQKITDTKAPEAATAHGKSNSNEVELNGFDEKGKKAIVTIRLANGERFKIHCNPSVHRVSDLYEAVRNHLQADRGINLVSGRPPSLLSDGRVTVEEAGLVNCLIQQEWQK